MQKIIYVTALTILFFTTNAQTFWQKGGNAQTPPNAPSTLGTDASWNAPLQLITNGTQRMIIDGGNQTQTGGRIAIGNNLPNNFAPQSRVHIHQTGGGGLNNTFIRFTTNVTNNTASDGFAIGNSTQGFTGNTGEVHLLQYEREPIIMSAPNSNTTNLLPYEWFRLENGKTIQLTPSSPLRSTDGCIGLNKSNPRAHIDMVTPAIQGGEEFLFAKPDDVSGQHVQMGMMNLTGIDHQFVPGFFGNINQINQIGAAFTSIGAIHNTQDIASNIPVTRFISGRDWEINMNVPTPTRTLTNRPLFGWFNADVLEMYMDSWGRLRIGQNLIMNNSGPQAMPNNRLEITANVADPYLNPNGNLIGNPNFLGMNAGCASGLRFTFLTSRDLVIAPNSTNEIDPSKVLSVDKNGDVIAIYPALGAACTNSAQLAGQAFTSNRAVNQNNFNMEWRNGRSGFGTNNCTVGNRVEIAGLAANQSGLRFSNVTSASPVSPTSLSQNKVLAVDPNGDVILVADQTGTVAAGSVNAQNGLSMVGTNTVELGGTLLHNTSIDLATSNLSYYTGTTQRYERMPNGSVQQRAEGTVLTGQGSFNDAIIATNTSNWNYGRVLSISPQTSAVSPSGAGLEGFRLYAYGAPAASTSGISGDLYGFHAITNNSLSTGINFAVRGEANSWTGSSNPNIGVCGTGNFG